MKQIDNLIFNKVKQTIIVSPIQDGEEVYPNLGIKIVAPLTHDDGYLRLTSQEKLITDTAFTAAEDIVSLAYPETPFEIAFTSYRSEKTDDEGNYKSGNNVTVHLKTPIMVEDEEIRMVSTGNLRDYAAIGVEQQSIKDRIDALGVLVTQLLNS